MTSNWSFFAFQIGYKKRKGKGICMCINNTQQSLGFLVKLENKKHVKLQCNIGIRYSL